MHEAELEFIEQMGLMYEEDGLPRIGGRIFGLLVLREGPFSLDDMTEVLGVSKTSASTNSRLLERMGFLVRTSKPGDRRDFYRMAPDAPERSFIRIRERLTRTLGTLDRTASRLQGEGLPRPPALAEMRDWHAFLLEEIDGIIRRWKQRRDASSPEGRQAEEAV